MVALLKFTDFKKKILFFFSKNADLKQIPYPYFRQRVPKILDKTPTILCETCVADPDPYGFGPSRLISQRYGSGIRILHHQAKNLDSFCFVTSE
jgi:hypothetical protein